MIDGCAQNVSDTGLLECVSFVLRKQGQGHEPHEY